MATFQVPEALEFMLPSMPGQYKSPGEGIRTLAAYGGRGSAKSHSVARGILARCITRPTRWLNAREYQSSIKESVHQLYCSLIHELGLGSDFDIQRDQIICPNGGVLSYVGLHDKSLDNLKSYEGYDGAWVEEAQSMSKRSLQFLKPTIRKDDSQIIYTFNPENEEDPIYQELVARPPKNAIIRKVSWFDNPWFNKVLQEEKDADYARNHEDAEWIWGGNCRRNSEKTVLRRCETRPFTPSDVWDGPYQGIDFGFGQDPVCLIRCWIWEGDLYIEYEAYGEHTEIEDHPALFDSIPGARDYLTRADNSRPEMISFLKRNGYNRVTACQKWAGCVEDRISYLKSFNKIIIHPRCPKIAHEAKLWAWKTNKAGDILNVLQPGYDHGWDAVGYGLEPHILGLKAKLPQEPEPEEFPGMSQYTYGNGGWLR